MRWLLLGVVALAACAQGRVTEPRAADVYRLAPRQVRRFVFPSGLAVLLERDATLPAVAVVSFVGLGSVNDPPGKEGLAHLVEHLSYLGRGQGGGNSRGAALEQLAAAWNANTSWDATSYWAVGGRDEVASLLSIEAARLADPLGGVGDDDFDRERAVVLNEVRLRGETLLVGQELAWLQAGALPAIDPYARPVAGTERSVSRLTLADARAVAAGYRPGATTIYVAGDIDLDGAPAILAALPAALTGGSPVEAPAVARLPMGRLLPGRAPSEPEEGDAIIRHQAAVPGPELWLAWTLPGAYGPTRGIDLVLARAVQEALAGTDLRSRDISATSVFAVAGARETLLVCRASLLTGRDPALSFDALASRVALRWNDAAYNRYRFTFLRGQTATRLLLDEDGLIGRALTAAEGAHFTGDPDLMRKRALALADVDADALAEMGKRYLPKARARGIFVEPLAASAQPAPGPIGVNRATTAPAPTTEAPAAGTVQQSRRLGPMTRSSLDNGLQIVAVRRPGAVVTVMLGFKGGAGDGPVVGAALAFEEAVQFPPMTPPETFGMVHQREYAYDQVVHMLRGSVVSLPAALHYLRQEQEVHFEWPSRPLLRRVSAIQQAEQAPEARARRALRRALLGDHPYAVAGQVKDVLAVTTPQLRAWWQAHLRPDNALLVVVGDVAGPEVVEMARRELGSWRTPSSAPPLPDAPFPPVVRPARPGNVVITNRPGAVQAEITLACLLPPIWNGDTSGADVLARVMERDLWQTLRERMGATYDVSARVHTFRGGLDYLTLSMAIDHPHLEGALSVLRGYWDQGAGILTAQSVARAGQDGARGSLLDLATGENVARALLDHWTLGWSFDGIDVRPAKLAAVSPSALAPLLATCQASAVTSIVGDEPTIRAAWR
jgi:zinc protease